MGLNLPARNVFINPIRWQQNYAGRFQRQALPLADFDNMSGRAGRLGHAHEFGRAIIVTENKFDAETLFRTYVRGSLGELKPALKSDALRDHVLNLVASRRCTSRGQLRTFLLASYTGELRWRGEENEPEFLERLDEAIEHCVNGNLIQKSGPTLEVTKLGLLTATKGLSAETSAAFYEFVNDRKHCAMEVHTLEVLLALTNTVEAMGNQLKLNRESEYYDNSLELKLFDSVYNLQPTAARRLRSYYSRRPQSEEQAKNLKKTLLLRDWIDGCAFDDLERSYECAPGAVRNFAAEFRWLCDGLESIATLMRWPPGAVKSLRLLTLQLAHGVTAEAVVFCEAKIRGLERSRALALAEHGVQSLEEAAAMPMSELEKIIPRFVAMNLVQHVKAAEQNQKTEPGIVQDLDEEMADVADSGQPVVPSLERPADMVGNPFSVANVKLQISGLRQKQRAAVMLNGEIKTLSSQPFEVLLRLALAMKKDGVGWVSMPEESDYKKIQRLRDALGADESNNDGLIENDGAKRYRLSIPADSIELDKSSILKSFPDVELIFAPPATRLAAAS
jgi:replicative superfamily II helicase